MALDGRTLKVGDLLVRDDGVVFQRFSESAKSRSENNGHINVSRNFFTNVPRRRLRAVENRAGHPNTPSDTCRDIPATAPVIENYRDYQLISIRRPRAILLHKASPAPWAASIDQSNPPARPSSERMGPFE